MISEPTAFLPALAVNFNGKIHLKYPSLFHFLSIEFGKANIPFILVGGFAVNYYGVSRATGDVDLLMTEANYNRTPLLFTKGGYREVLKQHLFVRLQNEKYDFIDIDVLFVDPKTFEEMYKQAKEVLIQNNKIKTPSFQNLIALKLHSLKHNPSREIPDLIDIVNLLRANEDLLTKEQFQELCSKFGNQDVQTKVMGAVTWKS